MIFILKKSHREQGNVVEEREEKKHKLRAAPRALFWQWA